MRSFLTTTSHFALLVAAVGFAPAVQATTFSITNGQTVTAAQTLSGGQTGTIQTGGTLNVATSSSTPAVTTNSTSAGAFTSSGTLTATGANGTNSATPTGGSNGYGVSHSSNVVNSSVILNSGSIFTAKGGNGGNNTGTGTGASGGTATGVQALDYAVTVGGTFTATGGNGGNGGSSGAGGNAGGARGVYFSSSISGAPGVTVNGTLKAQGGTGGTGGTTSFSGGGGAADGVVVGSSSLVNNGTIQALAGAAGNSGKGNAGGAARAVVLDGDIGGTLSGYGGITATGGNGANNVFASGAIADGGSATGIENTYSYGTDSSPKTITLYSGSTLAVSGGAGGNTLSTTLSGGKGGNAYGLYQDFTNSDYSGGPINATLGGTITVTGGAGGNGYSASYDEVTGTPHNGDGGRAIGARLEAGYSVVAVSGTLTVTGGKGGYGTNSNTGGLGGDATGISLVGSYSQGSNTGTINAYGGAAIRNIGNYSDFGNGGGIGTGVSLGSYYTQFTNSGTINAQGGGGMSRAGDGVGVLFGNYSGYSTLTNHGTITAKAGANGNQYVYDYDARAISIEGGGHNTVTLASDSIISGGIRISSASNNITNDGSISLTSVNLSGVMTGIAAAGGNTITLGSTSILTVSGGDAKGFVDGGSAASTIGFGGTTTVTGGFDYTNGSAAFAPGGTATGISLGSTGSILTVSGTVTAAGAAGASNPGGLYYDGDCECNIWVDGTGHIGGNATGVSLAGANEQATNNGTITAIGGAGGSGTNPNQGAAGGSATGLQISGNNNTFTNHGTITATAGQGGGSLTDGIATAVFIGDTFPNPGASAAGNAVILAADSIVTGKIRFSTSGTGNSVTNSGSITVSGTDGANGGAAPQTEGIFVENSSASVTLNSGGSFTVTGGSGNGTAGNGNGGDVFGLRAASYGTGAQTFNLGGMTEIRGGAGSATAANNGGTGGNATGVSMSGVAGSHLTVSDSFAVTGGAGGDGTGGTAGTGGNAVGLLLAGANIVAENSGTLEVTGGGGGDGTSQSIGGNATGLRMTGSGVSFTNTGTLTATGGGIGAQAGNAGSHAGAATLAEITGATGTFINHGTLAATGLEGIDGSAANNARDITGILNSNAAGGHTLTLGGDGDFTVSGGRGGNASADNGGSGSNVFGFKDTAGSAAHDIDIDGVFSVTGGAGGSGAGTGKTGGNAGTATGISLLTAGSSLALDGAFSVTASDGGTGDAAAASGRGGDALGAILGAGNIEAENNGTITVTAGDAGASGAGNDGGSATAIRITGDGVTFTNSGTVAALAGAGYGSGAAGAAIAFEMTGSNGTLVLGEGSAVTGKVVFSGTGSELSIRGATFGEAVDFGSGENTLRLDKAVLTEDFDAGNGVAGLIVEGSGHETTLAAALAVSGTTEVNGGSTLTLLEGGAIEGDIGGDGTGTLIFDGEDAEEPVAFTAGGTVKSVDLALENAAVTTAYALGGAGGEALGDISLHGASTLTTGADVAVSGTISLGGDGAGIYFTTADEEATEPEQVTADIVSAGEAGLAHTISFNNVTYTGRLSFGDADETLHVEDMTLAGPVDLGAGDDRVELVNGGGVGGSLALGTGDDTLYAANATLDKAVDFGTGSNTLILDKAALTEDFDAGEDVASLIVQGNGQETTLAAALAVAGTAAINDGSMLTLLDGGAIDGDVSGDGTGTLKFDGAAAATPVAFAAGGTIKRVDLVLENAAFTTAHVLGGAGESEALGNIDVLDGSTFTSGADVTASGTLRLGGDGAGVYFTTGDEEAEAPAHITADIVSSLADDVGAQGQARTVSFENVVFTGALSFGDADDLLHVGHTALGGALDFGAGDDRIELVDGGTLGGSLALGAGNDAFYIENAAFDKAVDFGAGANRLVLDKAVLAAGFDAGDGVTDLVVQGNGHETTLAATLIVTGTAEINGGSRLTLLEGGAIDGDIGGDGTGTLTFDGEDAEEPVAFAAGGTVRDVDLVLANAAFTTTEVLGGGGGALGRIDVLGGSVFRAGADVTAGGALQVADSTVRIGAGHALTVDHMSASSNGTLIFGLDADDAAGRLVVADGAVSLQGTTVKIDLTTPSTFAGGAPVLLADGSAPLIGFDGNTGLAGRVLALANTAFYKFFLKDGGQVAGGDDTELYAISERVRTIAEVGRDKDSNNAALGGALDGLTGTSDPALSAILTSLGDAEDSTAANAILSTLTPAGNGATQGTLGMLDAALDVNGQRLNGIRTTGVSGGNGFVGRLKFWTQAFGGTVRQGLRHGEAGYDAGTAGVAVGADSGELLDSAVTGLAFNYAKTNVNAGNANNTGSDIDSYQLTAYAEYDLGAQAYINGQATYGFNRADTVRYNVGGLGGSAARGSFTSSQYALRAESGKSVQTGRTLLTPRALAHWTHYVPRDYTETGAGGASLAVNQKSMDVFALGGGIEASWKLRQANGASLVPALSADYSYDLVGDKVSASSAFIAGGAAFETEGVRPARGTLGLGASVRYKLPGAAEFIASYAYERKSDYNANAGYLHVGYRF